MEWEPDPRSNFFFSSLAHLCAITYTFKNIVDCDLKQQLNSTRGHGVSQILYTIVYLKSFQILYVYRFYISVLMFHLLSH